MKTRDDPKLNKRRNYLILMLNQIQDLIHSSYPVNDKLAIVNKITLKIVKEVEGMS